MSKEIKERLNKKYVKLGPKADVFMDIETHLTVTKGQVVLLTLRNERSKRIQKALRGGHLVSASKDEYVAYRDTLEPLSDDEIIKDHESEMGKKATEIKKLKAKIIDLEKENASQKDEILELKATGDEFEDMTNPELVDYINNTWKLTDEDKKAIKKFRKQELLDYIKENQEPDE